MVPHIAQRGSSFKGAGMYYLHDKEALTDERVGWVQTHNVPTQDPNKALKWMAYTSMNANTLKRNTGVAVTGRKSSTGPVYSFSLAWHPDQTPGKEHMIESAFEALQVLDLQDHQCLLVSHTDTPHPHVHCIVNLTHPQNGKQANPYKDRLKLSEWAENYERQNGKIYCEQRVINNELRGQKLNKNKIIKHREQKSEKAKVIQDLYTQSDSGGAFKAALKEKGYTLAQGNKGRLVLVDGQGKIIALARQLQGQRAADIKNRLKDVNLKTLPHAKNVASEKQHFDRDQYEIEWQKGIVDAAIESAEEKDQKEADKPEQNLWVDPLSQRLTDIQNEIRDATFEYAGKANEKIAKRKRELEEFYDRKEVVKRIADLSKKLKDTAGKKGGQKQKSILKERLENAQADLEQIDWRMGEQMGKLKKELEKGKPEKYNEAKIIKDFRLKKDGKSRKRDDDKDRPHSSNKGDFDLDR